MRILNRIINILILLAAIAAVVFSYMLFSKREKLVNGWDQMAKAISATAKTIDAGGASGTKAGLELADEKLKHTNYDQLPQILPKLKENAEKIVAQRNALADSVQQAATTLSIQGIEGKDLKNIASYQDKERVFNSKVQEFRSVRDKVSEGFADTAKIAGSDVNASEFNGPTTYSAAIEKASSAVQDTVKRRNDFANYVAQVVRTIGIQAPRLTDKDYPQEFAKTLKSVQAYRQEFAETKSQLSAEKSRADRLSGEVETHKKTIVAHLTNIRNQKNKIDELTNILTKDGSIQLPQVLLTGKEPECYKYVKGTIEYIDNDFGFVTIDIGKNYTFTQRYGIKDNKVAFPLTAGKILTVARGLNTNQPVFVGKVFVTKVDDNSAICNLMGGKPADFKVGDTVFFSDDDINAALQGNAKKSTAKQ